MKRNMPPTHPGEVLLFEHIKPQGLTYAALSEMTGIDICTLNRICNKKARVTARVDLKLSEFLGTPPGYWLELQSKNDIYLAIEPSSVKTARQALKEVG